MSNGTQVGEQDDYARLWRGTANSVVILHPNGYDYTSAYAVEGNTQVSYGEASYIDPALLWHGTAASVVDIHPTNLSGFQGSFALGISGSAIVGIGQTAFNDYSHIHALLWRDGTAGSAVDLHPAGFAISYAFAVSGNAQVGYSSDASGNDRHALLWHGTAASVVDLSPLGFESSAAGGVSGNSQVGYGDLGGNHTHALLWHGSAASVIDLHPAGFFVSSANAVSGNTQVGYGYRGGKRHALVWHGTAASVTDLNDFLPDGFTEAIATDVDSDGDIVGYGSGPTAEGALLWRFNKTPALAVTGLNPDTVDMGHGAFTLSVTGTKFVPSTVVRWNGQALTTTYQSSTHLTAQVPASLVVNSGTALITVQTPNVATSGALTFHIRPLLTNVSPASVNAGHAPFTLTVNGAGYTSNALVIFDGTNLATHFVSPTQLTATVPAALVALRGRKSVMVTLPHVATSRGFGFDVTP